VTTLRFSGGEVIEIALSLNKVRKLLQEAIAKGVLLELQAPDGRTIIVNPQQVQLLQDADASEGIAAVTTGVSGRIQTPA